LRKLDDPDSNYTALILASAGLIRLSLGNRITQSIGPPTLYPAVGQGALAIEIRQGDIRSQEIIGSLECWKTSWMTRSERMMLKVLEGGCSVPVGCETKLSQVWVKGGEGDLKENRVNGFITPQVHQRNINNNKGGYFGLPPNTNNNNNDDSRLIIPSPHLCPHHDTQSSLHHAVLTLTGTITSLSGLSSVVSTISRKVHSVDDCETLGRDVALELIEGGGKEILTELGRHVKEVGGEDSNHDGKEIPISSVPGSTANGSSDHPHPHAIEIPIHPANHEMATDQVLESMQAVSPTRNHNNNNNNGFQLSKSPKSGGGGGPKVFRVGSNEGKCLRPQGW